MFNFHGKVARLTSDGEREGRVKLQEHDLPLIVILVHQESIFFPQTEHQGCHLVAGACLGQEGE